LKILLENVNLSSTSGPNSFAQKLVKYMTSYDDVSFDDVPPDVRLCFIESNTSRSYGVPLYQRLDGIYFNTQQNHILQNAAMKSTYKIADGVIFQSEFNKELIFKYFGPHDNYSIIHNGADSLAINDNEVAQVLNCEKLWCCASSWRPHKRLNENLEYFLSHKEEGDCMVVAGDVATQDRLTHDNIHYAGVLTQQQLYALYKAADYFIHLAWLDHCPNVVVDARACGCQIICSSTGGTKEIAGSNAIVIEEDPWNFEPVELYSPPKLNFDRKIKNDKGDSEYDMSVVAKQYLDFLSSEV